jgi:hypothetical protein
MTTFPLGRLLVTPGALEALASHSKTPLDLLRKHMACDWSEMDEEDRNANNRAIGNGARVFSAYTLDDDKFFVITEADRAVTTVLLAHEY